MTDSRKDECAIVPEGIELAVRRAFLRLAKSRIVADVTGEDDVPPQQDRTERPLVWCVPARGIEVSGVAPLVKQDTVSDVLGEHGRGAIVVFAIRHQHPVVRDEPLGARGEIIEEEARIERRLQRLAERRDAGQQICELVVHRGGMALVTRLKRRTRPKRRGPMPSCRRSKERHAVAVIQLSERRTLSYDAGLRLIWLLGREGKEQPLLFRRLKDVMAGECPTFRFWIEEGDQVRLTLRRMEGMPR